MGVITSGFWLAAGFGLGVAFKVRKARWRETLSPRERFFAHAARRPPSQENGGKIDWEGGERLLRQQVKLLPERVSALPRKALF
jgi:hypothetical protein